MSTTFPQSGRTTYVPILEAEGMVTAGPVYAGYAVPIANVAAMDGFAVCSRDTTGARDQLPLLLPAAVRINTGNVIPPGCDAVIMIEDCWLEGGRPMIRKAVNPGTNVRKIGEDLSGGELVLSADHQIRATDISALASYGITSVLVKQISIGVIPTGSELIAPGTTPKPGQVVDSNSVMIEAMLRGGGVTCTRYPPVSDETDRIREQVIASIEAHDLVIITGGSSVGTRDYCETVLSELGEVIFHGVAIKPGKSVLLASVQGKPVLGLPGYPLAAHLVLRELVLPLIRAWGLVKPQNGKRCRLELGQNIASDCGIDEFVNLSIGHVSGRYVGLLQRRGASIQMSQVHSNGYLHIPAALEGYEAGTAVDAVITVDQAELDRTLLIAGVQGEPLDLLGSVIRQRKGVILPCLCRRESGVQTLIQRICHAAMVDSPVLNRGPPRPTIRVPFGTQGLISLHLAKIPVGIVSKERIGLNDMAGRTLIEMPSGSPVQEIFENALRRCRRSDAVAEAITTGVMKKSSEIARAVQSGLADTGLGTSRSAEDADLAFFPLGLVSYDLLIAEEQCDEEQIETLIAATSSPEYKEMLERSGGYLTDFTGEIYHLPPCPGVGPSDEIPWGIRT